LLDEGGFRYSFWDGRLGQLAVEFQQFESMSQPSNQPVPRYVVCDCQHCDGHIEFDANALAEENSVIPCPHCSLETKLFIPASRIENAVAEKPPVLSAQSQPNRSPEQIRYLTSIGVPDADKLDNPNHPWQHECASPKQVAYLTYMGVANAGQLTKKEAADLIESNPFYDGANSLSAFDRVRSRQDRWHEERLKLYPDLYTFELKEFLHDDLPNSLHGYVRQRIVGASEKLTKRKIQEVVAALTREDARWWHQSDHQAVFFERLRQTHPGCCDGRAPE
jgi:hypothetical protein